MVKKVWLVLALIIVTALGGLSNVTAHPMSTDDAPATLCDPADEPCEPHSDHQHGGTGGHLPASSKNVQLLSKIKLTNVPSGISDVGALGNYAYLGAFSPECAGRPEAAGTGVHVVDVSNAISPIRVAFIPAHPNSFVGEGVQVFHAETPSFKGDILVHNNETCDSSEFAPSGFSLWDVTDPRNPTALRLNFGDAQPPVRNQQYHTTHSAMGWWVPETGRAYVMATDNQEVQDVDIFDITDPRNPVQIADTGFNNWPGARAPLANGDTVFNHDFQIRKIGNRWLALVSYWDAGWVILDVTDPANPVFVNDTDYPTPDPLTGFAIPEGNGHQAWWSSNGEFIIGTDEDFSPTRTDCKLNDAITPCGEFGWTVPLSEQFPNGFHGRAVWGGSGCVEDVDGNGISDRQEVLNNVRQEQTGADVIVFTRGTCFFSIKVETGELAGYRMVAIGQSHGGSRNGLLPDSFICGGQGSPVLGIASAICLGHRATHELFGDPPEYLGSDTLDMPAKGTLGGQLTAFGGVFDGWGYVHLIDAKTLKEIGAYAVPEALDPAFQAGFGNLTVHEVQTDPRPNVNLAYLSYYDAGLRVVKFGKNGIHEVGHFIAEGGNDFWGIEPLQQRTGRGNPPGGQPGSAPLLLLSDRDSGLWIFRYTGD